MCTVRARPLEVPMRSTGVEQRISPPRDAQPPSQRRVSSPAPPSGTGNPTVWPIMLIISAIRPEPGESSGMSAWPGVAGEHDPRCLAAEAVAAEVGSGGEQGPHELEATGTAQVQQAGEPGANRRERE